MAEPLRATPAADPPRSGTRFLDRSGRGNVVSLGLSRRPLSDLYHLWLTASWTSALVAAALAYFGINVFFAMFFLWSGGLENAVPGSFADAFFFSVQTFSTVGYGHLAPISHFANVIVSVESFVGLLCTAMITGLMFAKFARPSSRVLWARVAVVAPQDGVRSLMLRVANERGNQVVEAQVRLALVREEFTVEGERVRRVHDLKLVRAQSAVFALTWTVVHRIDEHSLLHGLTAETMKAQGAELVASLTGLDETFAQTIHSRHSWAWDEVLWDTRYADVIGTLPDGRRSIDYSKFHDTRPVQGPPANARGEAT